MVAEEGRSRRARDGKRRERGDDDGGGVFESETSGEGGDAGLVGQRGKSPIFSRSVRFEKERNGKKVGMFVNDDGEG